MLNSVKNFIKENNLSGKKILIGLSGGVDSAVLCDILSKIDDIKLIAIHLNHNWRGAESKTDEDFARNFANSRKIEFYTETLSSETKKTETDARELRYNFFEKCKNKFKADAIFLAHNKNDNIETLIYRLIKGTGPRGLNSIPKIRDFYFRPLIDFTREEIENYASKNGVEFVVDKSNFNTKYKRNLIRIDILPLMEKINPDCIDSISNFIKVNKMNQKIVDKAVLNAMNEVEIEGEILRDKFLKLDIELKYEILNRKLQGIIKNRDFKTIEKLVNFIEENNSKKISIGKNIFLKIYDNKIYIEKPIEKVEESAFLIEGENKFLNYTILIEKSNPPSKFPDNLSDVQYLKLDFKNKYEIRTKKEGDIIVPFSSKTPQKLKTFFIKKKIREEKRGQIPLIALENEVLFIPNIMTSEKLRVEKTDKICYKITVRKD